MPGPDVAQDWIERFGLPVALLLLLLFGLGAATWWLLRNVVKPAVDALVTSWKEHLTQMQGFQERQTVAIEGLLEHERAEGPVLEAIRAASVQGAKLGAEQLRIARDWKETGVRKADLRARGTRPRARRRRRAS